MNASVISKMYEKYSDHRIRALKTYALPRRSTWKVSCCGISHLSLYMTNDTLIALMSLALFFKVKLPESNLAKNDLTLDVLLQITHKARSVLEKDSEHTSASNKSTSSSSRGEGRRLREITEADGDKRQDVLSLPSTRLEETSASACRKNIKSSKERKGGKENWRH